jgi:lipopolysaccharide transport system permease protein
MRRTNLLDGLKGLWRQRELILRLARREIDARYKGSFLGIVWALITPLMLLGIYAVVFGCFFGSRWPDIPEPFKGDFVVILFANLTAFALMGETWNQSAELILGNPNYVRKVVFPLEILPVVLLLNNLFHCLVSYVVLIVGLLILKGSLPWTLLLLPLMLAPMMLFGLAGAYAFASLGVFVRDIKHTVGLLTTVLFFLTPVFYSATWVAERAPWAGPWLMRNPLTHALGAVRATAVYGVLPDWGYFAFTMGLSAAATLGAFYLFQRLRRGFADVI